MSRNLPTPLERWKDSKVLLPTRYLAAAVHYFIYSQADQKSPMTNKFVAEKFSLSSSNLHRIITGRRYAGGHEGAKAAPDDHGEKYVKIAKTQSEVSGSGKTVGKGKGKGKGKSSHSSQCSKRQR